MCKVVSATSTCEKVGTNMQENITRREKLFDLMEENSAAIFFAGTPKIASADECYPFKVNTNFFYLTNVKQENSVLLLVKGLS